jgi:hypothetical protein
MNVHWLVAFFASLRVIEARALPFDLYTSSGLGLDMLDEHSRGTDHLGSDVEIPKGFKVNKNLFIRPFAL